MSVFDEFLRKIDNEEQRDRLQEILIYLQQRHPELVGVIKWNQPMFQHHGTFIIGFSTAKQHISIAPEQAALDKFETELKAHGYFATKQLFRISNQQEVNYQLLDEIVQFNMKEKADLTTFWRK